MKFTLEVRMVDEWDLCSDTRFLPEDDEYEIFLNALLDDLSRLDGVSRVVRSTSIFQIETTCSVHLTDLKHLLKPAFTPSMMLKLRFVSLVDA